MPNPREKSDFMPGTDRPITEFDFRNFIADSENSLQALNNMVFRFEGMDPSKKPEVYKVVDDIRENIEILKKLLNG